MSVQFGNQQFTYNINHCDVMPDVGVTKMALTSYDDVTDQTTYFDFWVSNYTVGSYMWFTPNTLSFKW